MGVCNTKYSDWLNYDSANKHTNLKTEFSAEYALQNKLNITTAQVGYHTTNPATDTTNASNITPELNQAVTHFAEASTDNFQ